MFINDIEYPNQMLDAIKENKLVVFAGAGASADPPTNLPNFEKLAEQLAEGTDLYRAKDEPCEVFLGNLKTNGIDVNAQAAEILSKSCLKHNKLHEAIVNLFITPEEVRIVTTNYDHMFEQVLDEMCVALKIFDAPALPLGDDFQGIVHVHGNTDCPRYMVVTDDDFGKAYLTDGYASRFLTKLFDSYTVLFVGYSYNDTILRYLTRAMSREHLQKRYILTDDIKAKWDNLGICPILYPKRSFAVMRESLDKMGIRAKRSLIEWKEQFVGISDVPPRDLTIDSEIDYCFENIERVRVLANNIQSEEWLDFLDEKKAFDSLFSEECNLTSFDQVWADWLAEKILGVHDDAFKRLISKHGNMISRQFADTLLRKMTRNNSISDDYFGEYLVILDRYIYREYDVYFLFREAHKRKLYRTCKSLFQKFWEITFLLENRNWIAGGLVDYRHKFLGDAYMINESWKLCESVFLKENAKEFLIFFRGKLEEMHYRYFEVGRGINTTEPWHLSMLVIEDREENYREEPLNIIVDEVKQLCEQVQKDDVLFLRKYIEEGLDSESIFVKKLFLKILRECDGFASDEAFDLMVAHSMLGFGEGKEQVFLLVAKIFCDLSEYRKDILIDHIEAIGSEKEYEKYNWCVWIQRVCTTNARINNIVKDILSRNDFRPRPHPELDFYTVSESWGTDRSPLSNDEMRGLCFDDLIDKLVNYNHDEFNGPTRRGLLDVFTECINDNYEWAKDVARSLIDTGIINKEVWNHFFQGVYIAKYSIPEFIEMLLMLNTSITEKGFAKEMAKLLYVIVRLEGFEASASLYESKLFGASLIIWRNREKKAVLTNRLIDLSLNTTIGLVLMSLIYLISFDSKNEIKTEYKEFFEESILLKTWEKKVSVCVLAGHFNFFCYRDRKWCEEQFVEMLKGRKKDTFVAAWGGIIYYSMRLNTDLADVMSGVYFVAVNHLDWLSGEIRKGFIDLYLILLIYVVKNPTQKYIPAFYKAATQDDRLEFVNTIERQLHKMEDKSKKQWWDSWLKRYLENIKSNKPVIPSNKELEAYLNWLPEMKNVYDEAVAIICRGKMPTSVDNMFLHRLNESKLAVTNSHSTVHILTMLLNAGNSFDYSTYYIKDIVDDLVDITSEEKTKLEEALLKQNIKL